MRQVSYQEAEAACEILAAKMMDILGHSELKQCRYAPIPRGGVIVLGMLSYMLNLDWENLLPTTSHAPLVVVDDCSLSGVRFSRFLATVDDDKVIFAHLYSCPELRQAILEREPRVVECIAAYDLRDIAREVYPYKADYQAWQERWRERLPGTRYWIGQPELVVFPWCEPDYPVWNPATQQVEGNWRFTPPDRCLKNRADLQMPPSRVHFTPEFRSGRIAYRVLDESIFLCNLLTEQAYELKDVAAEMWKALMAYQNLEAVKDVMLSCYDVEEATLENDLSGFVGELLEKGIIERAEGEGEAKLE